MQLFIHLRSMETKFNFNSQVCTSRSQSERLLALGLKKETADMCHMPFRTKVNGEALDYTEHCSLPHGKDIPAWSLHRLIEMNLFSCDPGFVIQFDIENINDAYEFLVGHIEWLIKEGYLNKDYLV